MDDERRNRLMDEYEAALTARAWATAEVGELEEELARLPVGQDRDDIAEELEWARRHCETADAKVHSIRRQFPECQDEHDPRPSESSVVEE